MDNSIFYKDVVCVITNEGKSLIVKQSNGIKFSKVGAVLFSDKNKTIKNLYDLDNEQYLSIKNISLQQLKNYTTLIYKNIQYTLSGNIFTPVDVYNYTHALDNTDNLLPIQLSYGDKDTGELDEDEEPIREKYISYDFILSPKSLSINSNTDMNFDGFAILGLPFKQTLVERNLPIIQQQTYAILALVYFPNETQKLQILYNQPNNVVMNYEIHINMNESPIQLDKLSYTTNKDLEPKRPERFLYGIHLTNDGKHDKG